MNLLGRIQTVIIFSSIAVCAFEVKASSLKMPTFHNYSSKIESFLGKHSKLNREERAEKWTREVQLNDTDVLDTAVWGKGEYSNWEDVKKHGLEDLFKKELGSQKTGFLKYLKSVEKATYKVSARYLQKYPWIDLKSDIYITLAEQPISYKVVKGRPVKAVFGALGMYKDKIDPYIFVAHEISHLVRLRRAKHKQAGQAKSPKERLSVAFFEEGLATYMSSEITSKKRMFKVAITKRQFKDFRKKKKFYLGEFSKILSKGLTKDKVIKLGNLWFPGKPINRKPTQASYPGHALGYYLVKDIVKRKGLKSTMSLTEAQAAVEIARSYKKVVGNDKK